MIYSLKHYNMIDGIDNDLLFKVCMIQMMVNLN